MNSVENSLEKTKEERIIETRNKWRSENKDKMALYARNYYHKRCEKDPEYKKVLCEKVKKNNQKKDSTIKRVGRPLKYPLVQ